MVIHQVRSLALTLALLRRAHTAAACLREHLRAHALRQAAGDTARASGGGGACDSWNRVEAKADHAG